MTFWEWFIDESGAAWIIGGLGIVWAIYTWLRRSRPAKVVVQETETLRLLDIHPSQRDKIQVTYTDSLGNRGKVDNLVQKTIIVYNAGTKDITEPIKLMLVFRNMSGKINQRLWEFSFVDTESIEPLVTGIQLKKDGDDDKAEFTVEIPHLNSFPAHRQYVRAQLITDVDAELENVRGSGKGWSSRCANLSRIERRHRSLALSLLATVLALALLSSLTLLPRLQWIGDVTVPMMLLGAVLGFVWTSKLGSTIVARSLGLRPAHRFES